MSTPSPAQAESDNNNDDDDDASASGHSITMMNSSEPSITMMESSEKSIHLESSEKSIHLDQSEEPSMSEHSMTIEHLEPELAPEPPKNIERINRLRRVHTRAGDGPLRSGITLSPAAGRGGGGTTNRTTTGGPNPTRRLPRRSKSTDGSQMPSNRSPIRRMASNANNKSGSIATGGNRTPLRLPSKLDRRGKMRMASEFSSERSMSHSKDLKQLAAMLDESLDGSDLDIDIDVKKKDTTKMSSKDKMNEVKARLSLAQGGGQSQPPPAQETRVRVSPTPSSSNVRTIKRTYSQSKLSIAHSMDIGLTTSTRGGSHSPTPGTTVIPALAAIPRRKATSRSSSSSSSSSTKRDKPFPDGTEKRAVDSTKGKERQHFAMPSRRRKMPLRRSSSMSAAKEELFILDQDLKKQAQAREDASPSAPPPPASTTAATTATTAAAAAPKGKYKSFLMNQSETGNRARSKSPMASKKKAISLQTPTFPRNSGLSASLPPNRAKSPVSASTPLSPKQKKSNYKMMGNFLLSAPKQKKTTPVSSTTSTTTSSATPSTKAVSSSSSKPSTYKKLGSKLTEKFSSSISGFSNSMTGLFLDDKKDASPSDKKAAAKGTTINAAVGIKPSPIASSSLATINRRNQKKRLVQRGKATTMQNRTFGGGVSRSKTSPKALKRMSSSFSDFENQKKNLPMRAKSGGSFFGESKKERAAIAAEEAAKNKRRKEKEKKANKMDSSSSKNEISKSDKTKRREEKKLRTKEKSDPTRSRRRTKDGSKKKQSSNIRRSKTLGEDIREKSELESSSKMKSKGRKGKIKRSKSDLGEYSGDAEKKAPRSLSRAKKEKKTKDTSEKKERKVKEDKKSNKEQRLPSNKPRSHSAKRSYTGKKTREEKEEDLTTSHSSFFREPPKRKPDKQFDWSVLVPMERKSVLAKPQSSDAAPSLVPMEFDAAENSDFLKVETQQESLDEISIGVLENNNTESAKEVVSVPEKVYTDEADRIRETLSESTDQAGQESVEEIAPSSLEETADAQSVKQSGPELAKVENQEQSSSNEPSEGDGTKEPAICIEASASASSVSISSDHIISTGDSASQQPVPADPSKDTSAEEPKAYPESVHISTSPKLDMPPTENAKQQPSEPSEPPTESVIKQRTSVESPKSAAIGKPDMHWEVSHDLETPLEGDAAEPLPNMHRDLAHDPISGAERPPEKDAAVPVSLDQVDTPYKEPSAEDNESSHTLELDASLNQEDLQILEEGVNTKSVDGANQPNPSHQSESNGVSARRRSMLESDSDDDTDSDDDDDDDDDSQAAEPGRRRSVLDSSDSDDDSQTKPVGCRSSMLESSDDDSDSECEVEQVKVDGRRSSMLDSSDDSDDDSDDDSSSGGFRAKRSLDTVDQNASTSDLNFSSGKLVEDSSSKRGKVEVSESVGSLSLGDLSSGTDNSAAAEDAHTSTPDLDTLPDSLGDIPSFPTRRKKQRAQSVVAFHASCSALDFVQFTPANFVQQKEERFDDYYELGEMLGEGEFGEVFVGYPRQGNGLGEERAIKIIDKVRMCDGDYEQVINEFNLLKGLTHPNILCLYGFYEDVQKCYIVTDICKGGEMWDELDARGNFSEEDAAAFMTNVLSAVKFLQSHKIVHRDINLENILLEENKELDQMKIIDFGLATTYEDGVKLTELVGKVHYVAPEVLHMEYEGGKYDVWSCGVLCYIMLSGYAPFEGDTDGLVREQVLIGKVDFNDPAWEGISDEAKDFVNHLLTYEEDSRPTPEQALKHAWIQNSIKAGNDSFMESYGGSSISCLENMEDFASDASLKLKQAVYTFIASQLLRKEDREEIDRVFRGMDADCDGQLSKEDIKQGYLRFFSKDLSDKDVDKLFRRINISETGFIDYTEFVIAAMQKSKILDEEHLRAAFSSFDRGDKGFVSADDLKFALAAVISLPSNDDEGMSADEIIVEMVKQVDIEGDGKISYENFEDMMLASYSDEMDRETQDEEAATTSTGSMDTSEQSDGEHRHSLDPTSLGEPPPSSSKDGELNYDWATASWLGDDSGGDLMGDSSKFQPDLNAISE